MMITDTNGRKAWWCEQMLNIKLATLLEESNTYCSRRQTHALIETTSLEVSKYINRPQEKAEI